MGGEDLLRQGVKKRRKGGRERPAEEDKAPEEKGRELRMVTREGRLDLDPEKNVDKGSTLVMRKRGEERAALGVNQLLRAFRPGCGEAATSPAPMPGLSPNSGERIQEPDSQSLGLGQAEGDAKSEQTDQGGFGMEMCIRWLDSRSDLFDFPLRKVVSSGKVFPLPTSLVLLSHLFPEAKQTWLVCLRVLCSALNSLNGEGMFFKGDKPSKLQAQILEGLLPACCRVCKWTAHVPCVSWDEFFRVRGVDYKGDEILNAQWIRWANVAPALPREVGGVDLGSVVELGSHHYVANFEEYLLDPRDQVYVRPPRVMVPPECWEEFCGNMMERGVFSRVHEDEIFRVQGKLLLNGLFGVTKHEFEGDWEIMRVIMNLVPVNAVCRALDSDISTLPSWAGMSPLELVSDEELVVSSEDVRCFFYIFRIPSSWHRFMAFNRPLPPSLCGSKPGNWYPCSSVLPMGFKNSVSLAQHVHRVIAKKALARCRLGGELELREDRCFTMGNPMFRIYLDNFDELQRVSKGHAEVIAGKVSPLVSCLREEYSLLNVPRHPKKGVSSQSVAEVQGAIVDGQLGIAYPKPDKVLKYAQLAMVLLNEGVATQKQMQVVGGGLVYLAMFRRPLLGSLNCIWSFICSFNPFPPVVKLTIPLEVRVEIVRFLGLVPLSFLDFRCRLSGLVTASDASTTGGG